MAQQKPETICPGHGQVVRNGTARIQWYINHRQEREEQVLTALRKGARTVDDAINCVYPKNLRKNLRLAAARNIRTHLTKLQEEGRVTENGATYSLKGD
jgi:hypothetical protein